MEKTNNYKLLAILLSVIIILLAVFTCLLNYNNKSTEEPINDTTSVVTKQKTELEEFSDIINGTPTATYSVAFTNGGGVTLKLYENNVFWIQSGNGSSLFDDFVGTYTLDGDKMTIERKYGETNTDTPGVRKVIVASLTNFQTPVTETYTYSEDKVEIKEYLKGSVATYAGVDVTLNKE